MTVFVGSRYQYGTVTYLALTPDGDAHPVLHYSPSDVTNQTLKTVVCSVGDRFDTVAFDVYGDPTLWWRIAELNPHVDTFTELKPGQVIKVPA